MIKKFKLFENSKSQPVKKYPVDKCLDFMTVSQELEKMHNIYLYEVPCGTGGEYKNANFYSWVGENLDPIFPNPTLTDVHYELDKLKYSKVGMDATKHKYFEDCAIYELPDNYNPKNDIENWYLKIVKFKADMELMTKKPWNDENDKNINFGPQSNEWVNLVLHKIHELYPQYYKNGKIRIWSEREYEFDRGKEIYDYPLDESYFLSELENWLHDTFDVDTTGFCEWVLRNNYIEGRWWMRIWRYGFENENFRKEKAPKNIIVINDILKQIYKSDEMDIYFDYYKKIDDKKIY